MRHVLFVVVLLLVSCGSANLGVFFFPRGAEPWAPKSSKASSELEVVGYLPTYKVNQVEDAQLRHLTDLVYFSVSPTAISGRRSSGIPKDHLQFLADAKKNWGLKILLGISDHTATGPMSRIVRSTLSLIHI
jgi:hypothetical protein